MLAFCWSHFRRQFYDIAKSGNAPFAAAALDKIGELYGLEADIRTADERRSARMAHSKPLVDALKAWLGEQLTKLSKAPALADPRSLADRINELEAERRSIEGKLPSRVSVP